MSGTYKGRFKPQNPKKYNGDPRNIIFRSSWELFFLTWCDQNSLVESYSSEEKVVPYFDPIRQRWRRYFPDFIIHYRDKQGRKITEMIEIKPEKEVKGPNPNPKRKTQSWKNSVNTYITNQSKWKAASEYCENRGWKFRILTENQLFKNRDK